MILLKPKVHNGVSTNQPQMGHWPIPEDFLPDITNQRQKIPNRCAHPNITFLPLNKKPSILNNFAFDKYELEPSALTQAIISLFKQYPKEFTSNHAWYTYILGSNGDSTYNTSPAYVDHDGAAASYSSSSSSTEVDVKNLPPPFGYLKP